MNLVAKLRPLALGASFLLCAGSAHAQLQYSIVGNSRGCFGVGCTPAEAAATVLSGVPLSFSSSAIDFSGLTADGELGINTTGTSTTGNFGFISVGTASPTVAVTSPFSLLISFINPLTADVAFDVLLRGKVSVFGAGALTVDFTPTVGGSSNVNDESEWVPFFDPNTNTSGELKVTAYGTSIPSGGQGELTGLIEVRQNPPATVTPEPVTLMLLGTGLAGIAGAARRRRKQNSEDASD